MPVTADTVTTDAIRALRDAIFDRVSRGVDAKEDRKNHEICEMALNEMLPASTRQAARSHCARLVNASVQEPLQRKIPSRERLLEAALLEMVKLFDAALRPGFYDREVVERVDAWKELLRCSAIGCGLGGRCDGIGLNQYPCPLKDVQP
jgi:hypothetical protein